MHYVRIERKSKTLSGNKIQVAVELLVRNAGLRPFAISDADRVAELANNKLIFETTLSLPYPYKISMAENWIAGHLLNYLEKKGFVYAVCTKIENKIIGVISITSSASSHVGEIGYWIGVDYWNQGYCSEASIKVIKYGFNEYSYHKIRGRHFKENLSSGRVLIKSGMKYEGELVDEVIKDGKFKTLLLYGIINDQK